MAETIKGGLSARMRKWMSEWSGPFYLHWMCDGLDIPAGSIRHYMARMLQKFVDRGEVKIEDWKHKFNSMGQWRGPRYRYNHSWRRSTDAPMKKKILRAMRLISFHEPFCVADVQRLATAPERSYVDLLIRKLIKENHIHRVGIRVCPHGRESLYRVVDLSRFHIDLL